MLPRPDTAAETNPLLRVAGVSSSYREPGAGVLGRSRYLQILHNVDLDVLKRTTVGIVGETGSGKSTLMNCILRLHPVTAGSINFDGVDLLGSRGAQLRSLRRRIQGVFQNPFSSLDPHMHVFSLIAEPLRIHLRLTRAETQRRVDEVMSQVGLNSDLARSFAHQLSGGQAQRVAIARALTVQPQLLLLDEPTSALDVSVQAQIVNLLLRLQQEHGLTYIFVSHDMALVNHISDEIVVMYMGEIVERGPADDVVGRPFHPYTQTLLASAGLGSAPTVRDMGSVRGELPNFAAPPSGCRFHPRCPVATERCKTVVPVPSEPVLGHRATCHLLPSGAVSDAALLPVSNAGTPT